MLRLFGLVFLFDEGFAVNLFATILIAGFENCLCQRLIIHFSHMICTCGEMSRKQICICGNMFLNCSSIGTQCIHCSFSNSPQSLLLRLHITFIRSHHNLQLFFNPDSVKVGLNSNCNFVSMVNTFYAWMSLSIFPRYGAMLFAGMEPT